MISKLPKDVIIRNSAPSDHHRIISVLQEWWGGRDLTWMLPKLFLNHFCNTSFVMEKNDALIAFLIGFLSQSDTGEGYIHFAGVHPDYRGIGIGEYLYRQFYRVCKENKRDTIRACTSPVNKGSIEFHKKMGFQIEPGNSEVDGIPVTLDYNRPNDPKVLFKKKI
ncbi:MAG: GNAT family N-acetyltransferase [Thermodesulfobacteriota bacterium]|nr:GNAT family N-acetyltransferase [Thermodesulfobacteriota bacterium]